MSSKTTSKNVIQIFSENYNGNEDFVTSFMKQSLCALVHEPLVIKEQDDEGKITISIPHGNSVKKVAQKTGRIIFVAINANHIIVRIMLKGTPKQIHKDEICNLSFITLSGLSREKFSSDEVMPNEWHFTKNPSKDNEDIFHYLTLKLKLTGSLIEDFSKALTALLECKIFNNIEDSIFNYWLNQQTISSLKMGKAQLTPVNTQHKSSTVYKSNAEQEARVGQGSFRKKLMEESGRECMLSGSVPEQSLIASHIVPWKPSDKFKDNSGMPLLNEAELDLYRLDKNNGLLLNTAYDSLFDKFLMTVNPDGTLEFNDIVVSEEHKKNLGVSNKKIIDRKYLTKERKEYLECHNKFFMWNKDNHM